MFPGGRGGGGVGGGDIGGGGGGGGRGAGRSAGHGERDDGDGSTVALVRSLWVSLV